MSVCLFLSVYLAQHKVSCFLHVILCDSISPRIGRIVFCHVCGSIWRWSGRLPPSLAAVNDVREYGGADSSVRFWFQSLDSIYKWGYWVVYSLFLPLRTVQSFPQGLCSFAFSPSVSEVSPFSRPLLDLFDILKIAMPIDMWRCLLCFSWQRNLWPRLVLKPTTWLVL